MKRNLLNIIDKMNETPLVFDGAMGTVIYERGVFINTCYDELNLTNPKLIQSIHREYVEAGCDVIQGFYLGKPIPPEKVDELLSSIRK